MLLNNHYTAATLYASSGLSLSRSSTTPFLHFLTSLTTPSTHQHSSSSTITDPAATDFPLLTCCSLLLPHGLPRLPSILPHNTLWQTLPHTHLLRIPYARRPFTFHYALDLLPRRSPHLFHTSHFTPFLPSSHPRLWAVLHSSLAATPSPRIYALHPSFNHTFHLTLTSHSSFLDALGFGASFYPL